MRETCKFRIVSFLFAENGKDASGEPANGLGGALLCDQSSPAAESNTFFANWANGCPGLGSAVYCTNGSSPSIANSIFWKSNFGANSSVPEIWADPGSSPTVSYSLVEDAAWNGPGNQVGMDPQLVDPFNGDFHLLSASPAVDAGTNGILLNEDFEGDLRPTGAGYADIGADELNSLKVNLPTVAIGETVGVALDAGAKYAGAACLIYESVEPSGQVVAVLNGLPPLDGNGKGSFQYTFVPKAPILPLLDLRRGRSRRAAVSLELGDADRNALTISSVSP